MASQREAREERKQKRRRQSPVASARRRAKNQAKQLQQQIAAAAQSAAQSALSSRVQAVAQQVAPGVAGQISQAAATAIVIGAGAAAALAATGTPLSDIPAAVNPFSASAEVDDLTGRVNLLEANDQVFASNDAAIVERLTAEAERIQLELDGTSETVNLQGVALTIQEEAQAAQALELIAQATALATQADISEDQASEILTLTEDAAELLADVNLLDATTATQLGGIRTTAAETSTELAATSTALGVLDAALATTNTELSDLQQELDALLPGISNEGNVVEITDQLQLKEALGLPSFSDAELATQQTAGQLPNAVEFLVYNTDRNRIEQTIDGGTNWTPLASSLVYNGQITGDPAPASKSTIYAFNTTGGAFTFTLPAATGSGERIIVSQLTAANAVTVAVQAGEQLGGTVDATFDLGAPYEVVTFLDVAIGEWASSRTTELPAGAMSLVRLGSGTGFPGFVSSGGSSVITVNNATGEVTLPVGTYSMRYSYNAPAAGSPSWTTVSGAYTTIVSVSTGGGTIGALKEQVLLIEVTSTATLRWTTVSFTTSFIAEFLSVDAK